MCEHISNIILIVLVLVLLLVFMRGVSRGSGTQQEEGFYTYPGYYKRYCNDCSSMSSSYALAACSNCGVCTTFSGLKYGVPGDSTGPFYANDCYEYSYGDPYSFYPGANVFPVVKTMDQYPLNVVNTTGFSYMKGYGKYERELRNEAAKNRELARRLEHSKQ
jgi:hypothetical protein